VSDSADTIELTAVIDEVLEAARESGLPMGRFPAVLTDVLTQVLIWPGQLAATDYQVWRRQIEAAVLERVKEKI